MNSREEFANELAKMSLSHVDRAIALLWFYRNSQEFDERSPGELAKDLHDLGFSKPNVTTLKDLLKKSRYTIKGKRTNTFQIALPKLEELDTKYLTIANIKKITPYNHIIPKEEVNKTRQYLEKLVHQMNASYEFELFDCCAVMMRRLMESLIIEVYIAEKRKHEIQNSGNFFMLDGLINYIIHDPKVSLSRNSPKTMKEIKQLGDTSAHDRVYITQKEDIDELRASYRRLIHELLTISKIIT